MDSLRQEVRKFFYDHFSAELSSLLELYRDSSKNVEFTQEKEKLFDQYSQSKERLALYKKLQSHVASLYHQPFCPTQDIQSMSTVQSAYQWLDNEFYSSTHLRQRFDLELRLYLDRHSSSSTLSSSL